MRRFRSPRVLAFAFLAALYVCSGCASITPVSSSGPGQASCDGVKTVVDGKTLNLRHAAEYYEQQGARAAAELAREANHQRSAAWKRWLFGSVIGAIAGGAISAEVFAKNANTAGDILGLNKVLIVIAGLIVGFVAGTPFGLAYSAHLNGNSKQLAIQAAESYNAFVTAAHQGDQTEGPGSHSLPASR